MVWSDGDGGDGGGGVGGVGGGVANRKVISPSPPSP